MRLDLKTLQKFYGRLPGDRARALALAAAERLGVRKNIVRLDTNILCNVECIMCSCKPKPVTPECYMPFGDFQRIIDRMAPTTRFLYLSCGYEPLMTPRFVEYASYARRSGIPHISFATNGMLLSRPVADQLIRDRIMEVMVSYNGLTAADHERIMRRVKHDVVVRNLGYLAEAKRRMNSPFPRVRLNMMQFASNLRHFGEIASFMHDYDVQALQIREFDEGACNDPEAVARELAVQAGEAEIHEMERRIRAQVEDLTRAGKEIILPRQFWDKTTLARDGTSHKTSCAIPYFSYWIHFSGTARICPSDSAGVIGNMITSDPSELAARAQAFRRQALHGTCRRNCYHRTNLDSSVIL